MTQELQTSSEQSVALVPLGVQISPRAEQLKELSRAISRNEYGLPEYILRGDLLPLPEQYDDLEQTEQHNAQMAATLELDYSQGFAALPSGDALWTQLPHEPHDEYRAFQHFVNMPRNTDNANLPSAPVRQLNLLKTVTGKSSAELLSMAYLYYWPERARAYDLFMVASHVKQKELRTQSIEDKHFERAQKFIQYAEDFLEGVFQDPEHFELTPKEAFDMMFKMMQAQRLAVGLSPNGAHAGKDENKTPQNAALEVIMRTIAKNAGISDTNSGNQAAMTQQLLSDPRALEQAQELIIRMSNIQSPRGIKTGNHFDE